MSLGDRAIDALERHPAVRRVRLVGSRATGTATAASDWDFAVDTDDLQASRSGSAGTAAAVGQVGSSERDAVLVVMLPGW